MPGVDAVLLHTDPSLVRDSSYLQEIVERFPGRMYSMAPVDEWRIIPETDAVISETVRAVEEHGLHAVKFIPPLCYMTSDVAWDDGPYRPFWEGVTALGVPIFFTLGAGPDDLKGVKSHQVRGAARLPRRAPDAHALDGALPRRRMQSHARLSRGGRSSTTSRNPSNCRTRYGSRSPTRM